MKFEAANDNQPSPKEGVQRHAYAEQDFGHDPLTTIFNLTEAYLDRYTDYIFQEDDSGELQAEYETRVKKWTLEELYTHLVSNLGKPLNALTFVVLEEAANRLTEYPE